MRANMSICRIDQSVLGCLMQITTIPNVRAPSPALAKGQLWKTKDSYIQIVNLGKKLIDYRMMKELGQMRRTQTTILATMAKYLKANKARLVEGACRN